jgi:hypothetical protein
MGYCDLPWKVDERCVLPRGNAGELDCSVVGDPCIVWDEQLDAWRMFYFAQGGRGCCSAWAASRSGEDVAPGDWQKGGIVPLANPECLADADNWHKWWVVLEPGRHNRAACIDGSFWSLFVSRHPGKVIQVARAVRLSGPWHVVAEPILVPGPGDAPDGLNCDSPTAYWFAPRQQVLIYYKAYPRHPQRDCPHSGFGSASAAALWRPGQAKAAKLGKLLTPAGWAPGWIGGVQLLPGRPGRWEGLLNASPTAPADKSHREPAPSLGGWAFCDAAFPSHSWRLDHARSPILRPDDLSSAQEAAGLGTNFWRHHLLVTPSGRARIFFNSGPYGHEQMYSLTQ